MNDMDALERTFQRIRELPAEERERCQLVLDDMLAIAESAPEDAHDLDDPEYRAYVEQALEEAEQDRLAGRTMTADELRARLGLLSRQDG